MRRDIFSEEHEMFRTQVRRFVENELVPKIESWNRNGMSDRESWRKMGEAGFLGANAPAEYGGAGGDFLYDAIVIEELSRVRAHGLMMGLHSDIIMPYIASYGTDDLKRRYLAPAISGETILAIAMTEPGTGSDLAAVQTTARRDGDSYVINGSKMFISNGQIADAIVVVAKTDAKAHQPDHRRCQGARLRARPQARQARLQGSGH
jgi:acyl-CoA dehydrogenase